jgi:hypothetical protein
MLALDVGQVQKLGNFCRNAPATAFACGNEAVFLNPVLFEYKVARCAWWLNAVDSWRCFHPL